MAASPLPNTSDSSASSRLASFFSSAHKLGFIPYRVYNGSEERPSTASISSLVEEKVKVVVLYTGVRGEPNGSWIAPSWMDRVAIPLSLYASSIYVYSVKTNF